MNPLIGLLECGQSYWLDNLSRGMLRDGGLRRRVEREGLRGVTSNPAIFHKAISSGDAYDSEIRDLASSGLSVSAMYESLVVSDITEACDVLRPVFDESEGLDGYVSLEVSPRLIHDSAGSIHDGRRLWEAVDRPNLMIKIPGTPAGVPAIEELLATGINVNITLLFDVATYDEVARAYLRALVRRRDAGLPLDVSSVASFFLSRIDVLVDRLVGHRIDAEPAPGGPAGLLGEAGIASAKLAYRSFQKHFSGEPWSELAEAGARVQRLLWASTSAKNPLYDPIRYVEPLIGRDTVNTMPEETITAFERSGQVVPDTVELGVDEAALTFERLEQAGIDMAAVARQLVDEGADKFIAPFDALLAGLAARRREFAPHGKSEGFLSSGGVKEAVPSSLLTALEETRFSRRLYARDASLWSDDADVQAAIAARLGWLDLPDVAGPDLEKFERLADELVGSGIGYVVVLGMGGSSLAARVASEAFASVADRPRLLVLDDIDPAAVRDTEAAIDLTRTVFVVASKSGTTVETMVLFRHFLARVARSGVDDPGSRFIALTDPDTPLSREASQTGFRAVIQTPADVGGRFSALSAFGLLPMVLAGFDARSIVESARRQRIASGPEIPLGDNPSLGLGVALGSLAGQGRSRLVLLTSPRLAGLALWLEQLIAESTGKDGSGIVPLLDEPPRPEYGDDRVFVGLGLEGDVQPAMDARLDALETAGHPVVRLRLPNVTALGAEFYRWELATAAAAAMLGVNPFDEPDVDDAKRRARARLSGGAEEDSVSEEPLIEQGLELYLGDESNGSGSLEERICRWLDRTSAGDYLAILAYFGETEERRRLAARLREVLSRRTGAATTLGYGPRYLHSTGQLHKGGLKGASFLVLTVDEPEDIRIPGEEFGMAELRTAQARGDEEALRARGRRVARVNLGWYVDEGLARLTDLMAASPAQS